MKTQRIVSVHTDAATIECLTCNRPQTVEVDDGSVYIEQWPCSHMECTEMLCGQCDYFVCEYCDGRHCSHHMILYGGDKVCPTCFAGAVADCCAEELA